MSWTATGAHTFAFVSHLIRLIGPRPSPLLLMMLALISGCSSLTQTPADPRAPLAPEQVSDNPGEMIRFANQVRALPDAQRTMLIDDLQRQLNSGGSPKHTPLLLALALGQPDRATASELNRAHRLLVDYLADGTGNSESNRNLARFQLALLDSNAASAGGVAHLLKSANEFNDLAPAERKLLIRELEADLSAGNPTGANQLQLALLLSSGSTGNAHKLARAKQLIEGYLADAAEKPPALRDLARYQLHLVKERQRRLHAAQQEYRTRKELEQKLEALKAIELRMTGDNGTIGVPAQ